MHPEQLLIFGNPKAGTPLMVAAPTAGLDLPLRALVWEGADGKSWIAYNDPQYVIARHGLLPAAMATISPPSFRSSTLLHNRARKSLWRRSVAFRSEALRDCHPK
jgi:Domain of unknown function DUF302